MTSTIDRIRLDVLFDRPLLAELQRVAERAGLTGYTLLPAIGGLGAAGAWTEDLVTGAQSKTVFMSITSEEKAAAFLDALAPLLDSHRLLVISAPVKVVRGGKFA